MFYDILITRIFQREYKNTKKFKFQIVTLQHLFLIFIFTPGKNDICMPTSIKNKFNFTLKQGGNDEVKRPCFSAKAKRGEKNIRKWR